MKLLQRLRLWLHPDILDVPDDEALELQHAEERWKQEQTDRCEMEEVQQNLREADTARLYLQELESRLTSIRRLSDIRRPPTRRLPPKGV